MNGQPIAASRACYDYQLRPTLGEPVQLPDCVTGYLGDVDRTIKDIQGDLGLLWSSLSAESDQLDVLGRNDLPQMLITLIGAGGKRIRPVMCHLGWLAAGGQDGGTGSLDVVRAGAALELLQLFALIHDDVMDESASRRGMPTAHAEVERLHRRSAARGDARRFGENIAVLLGDLAHAEADMLAAELPASMRRLWRVLVVELVCGQRSDLVGSAAGWKDPERARQVARMKSGRYTVERPLQLGVAAAGGDHRHAGEALARYGEAVGDAFALRDDLLGVWGDSSLTGKPAGDDLLAGKPTIIVSLAAERLRSPSARRALARVGTPDIRPRDVVLLRHELVDVGVVDTVEEMITDHVAAAREALQDPAIEPAAVGPLTVMAHRIAWRDK